MIALVGGSEKTGKVQVFNSDNFSVKEVENNKFVDFLRTTQVPVKGVPLLDYIRSTTNPLRLLYKQGNVNFGEECIVFFGSGGIGTSYGFTKMLSRDGDIIVYSKDGFKSDYNFYFCGYLVSVNFKCSVEGECKYFVPVKQGSNRFCIRFYGDHTITGKSKILIGITVSQYGYKLYGYKAGNANVVHCLRESVNKHILIGEKGVI